MKSPKNMYIISDRLNRIVPELPIHVYEFIGRNAIPIDTHTAIHITAPDNLIVRRINILDLNGNIINRRYKPCDSRSLDDMRWEPIVRINGKWVIRNDLKSCRSLAEYNRAMLAEGYTPVPVLGYLTPKQYQKWVNNGLKKVQQHAHDQQMDINCI